MQSKKTSPKTSKPVEKAAVAAPETALAEVPAKARTSKSSRTKKSEGVDMTSGKHLHKSAAPVISNPVMANPVDDVVANVGKPSGDAGVSSETKRLSDAPARRIDAQQIAELAYSYFVERGGHHGSAEEDWLRAERELVAAR